MKIAKVILHADLKNMISWKRKISKRNLALRVI